MNIEILKKRFPDASEDELALLLYRAQQLGLDPIAGQIHLVKRVIYDPIAQKYVSNSTIQVGIDGFRLIAERSGLYDGQDSIVYIVEREGQIVETKFVLPNDKPVAAIATVYKKGVSRPFTGVAHYKDYVQLKRDGSPNNMWAKWPIMLAKCAEALAFRKGFPELHLSGIYEPAEFPADTGDISSVEVPIREIDGTEDPLSSKEESSETQISVSAEDGKQPDGFTQEKPLSVNTRPPTEVQMRALRNLTKSRGLDENILNNISSFESAAKLIQELNRKKAA